MNDKKEDDSFSTAKTNSSSLNKDNHSSKKEEDDFIHKSKTRGGIKHKINFFQPGRATISVPISSFHGISHNASFQSKLLFFNGGKSRPKFQHIPYPHERVSEDNKKNIIINKNEKKIEKKVEKKIEKKVEKKIEKKKENDLDDIDSNININQIMEARNKIINIDNKNNNKDNNITNKNSINIKNKEEDDIINIPKKNTVYIPSNQVSSLSLDYKIPGFSKIQKEEKIKIKKEPQNNINEIIKLKSFNDQWSFQKILLDYNILDFTSKFNIFLFI